MPSRTCTNGQSEIPNCFSAKSKSRAKAVVALSFAALCAVGLSGGGARAGFLEDLFGAFSGERRAAPARDYGYYSERRVVRRQVSSLSYIRRHHRKAARPAFDVARPLSDGMATAGPEASDLCYAVRPKTPDLTQPDAILHDATLREGDSVMTARGVRVFQGGGACPHKESDFLALADARDIPKSQRRALVAIEKAVRTPIMSARAGSFGGGVKVTSQ